MVDPLKMPGLDTMRPAAINAQQMRPPKAVSGRTGEGASFKEVLADAVTQVEKLQTEADTTIKQLVAGEIQDVSQAMVAVEKADVAFRTMMTVRGKMLSAYEEIMRMQV